MINKGISRRFYICILIQSLSLGCEDGVYGTNCQDQCGHWKLTLYVTGITVHVMMDVRFGGLIQNVIYL